MLHHAQQNGPRRTRTNQPLPDSNKKRVLIVDEQPLFVSGLTALINAQPDLITCCAASFASFAVEKLQTCPADIAIIDYHLPGVNGIELIKMALAVQPQLKILMLSIAGESHYALRALRAGALGYVMKNEPVSHVTEALQKIVRGEVYISSKLSEQFVLRSIRENGHDTPLGTLSPRELKVFDLFGRGLDTKSVAAEMDLSIKTVETYRLRIKRKLRFRKATEMVRFATNWLASEPEDRGWL